MCDPATMSIVAVSLAAAGAVTSGVSAYTGNQAQASIARYNASEAEKTGFANELAFRDQARRDIANQTAKLAANGGNIASGTPLLLLAESARNKELDAMAIRRNALGQAGGYRMQAKAYAAAAPLSAAGALLSGFGQAAGYAGGLGELGKIGGGGGAGGAASAGGGMTGDFGVAYG